MAIIKCKMCGGDLRIEEGSTVCECEYCGTRQTVPSADNEKKLTLFSRAGRLLRGCEFDKAAGVFETIVADFPEEAEAYWGLVLCKYGIEYVDDPATGKKIPTCHRSSFESVLDDPNFEQACENTDALARRVYRDEARQIEDLRKRIIEVSGKEEPYDVFISYKETGENGDRTLDSVIAQDIYTELTEKGYRVFFSRISLEDKLGTEYEPYIFAALNSAKVMLVVGTDYENFDAVWVKNEWSRFLKLIASGQKKTLIPVFKNMDAYDMPKEFAKLAAQDMGKVGAMQDLVRGVEKLIPKKAEPAKETVKETVVVQQSGGPNVTALLKRGQQALEDSEWDKAKDFFDQVLSMDAENAEAFLGLFLAGVNCSNEEEYIETVCAQEAAVETLSITPDTEQIKAAIRQYTINDYLPESKIRSLYEFDLSYPSTLKAWQTIAEKEEKRFKTDRNLVRAIRYAKDDTASRPLRFKAELSAALEKAVREAQEQERTAEENKRREYGAFLSDAEEKVKSQRREAQERQEAAFQDAMQRFEQAKNLTDYQSVQQRFLALVSYRDSVQMITRCDEKMKQIKQAEAEEAERQRVAREKAEKAARTKKKRLTIAAVLIIALAIASYFTYTKIVIPASSYKEAEALYKAGAYEQAIAAFEALGEYKDSKAKVDEAIEARDAESYTQAEELFASGKYDQALSAFEALGNYKDSAVRIEEVHEAIHARDYTAAERLLAAGDNARAAMAFGALGDYQDARARSFALWDEIAKRDTVAAGSSHTVGLKADGTVVATGYNNYGQCDVTGWDNVIAVAAGIDFTVGVKADGSVIAVGRHDYGQCNVSGWSDVVAVAAGSFHTVGLRSDGTVVVVGLKADTQHEVWTDIVAVAAGDNFTVGLKADGTVVSAGENPSGARDVSDWTNIVTVAAEQYNTVGLKADGTVVAVGDNYYGQYDVSDWRSIVAVAVGRDYIVGLKADGSVITTKSKSNKSNTYFDYGEYNVSDWHNIVAIAAGSHYTMGVRPNGTVIAVGEDTSNNRDVSSWTDIRVPNT